MAVRSPEEEEMYRPESGQLNDNMIFGDHDGNNEGVSNNYTVPSIYSLLQPATAQSLTNMWMLRDHHG